MMSRMCCTGRAGNKGTAITFIAPSEEKYAPDLVKALKESGTGVPRDLLALADSFLAKRKAGTAQAHGSGYGGSGFKFNEEEDEERRAARKVLPPPGICSCFLFIQASAGSRVKNCVAV